MITFLEAMTVLSTCLAMFLGAGALFYGVLFVWTKAINLVLPLFSFHKEFLLWVYEKYKPEVYTPKKTNPNFMKRKEDKE